jgi:viroplasmin and RNaseH domain-containing protein
MGHPNGGKGNTFKTNHTYEEAYQYVRSNSVSFLSTTDERIIAKAGYTKDKTTKTIVFMGERNRHGSTCKECWGIGRLVMVLASDNAQKH